MNITGKMFLLLIDSLILISYWTVYYYIRTSMGIFELQSEIDFIIPLFAVVIFWLSIFSLFGLYKVQQIKSRTDEFIQILKATTIGSLIIYIVVFSEDINLPPSQTSRSLLIYHWLLVSTFVSVGRISFITYLRKKYLQGKFLKNAIIVGWDKKGKEIFDKLYDFPALGMKVLGFISLKKISGSNSYQNKPLLGFIDQLSEIIHSKNISEVLIALESTDHNKLLKIIEKCEPHKVNFKILPDMYDVISGQLRTNQLYGFPLLEISPKQMQPWEFFVKRVIDILISILIIVLTIPISIIAAIAIKIESRGPIIFKQERVGLEGEIFIMKKFRTMIHNAEWDSGPIWSTQNDPRITKLGLFLRKTRLDEIPQLFNVLSGEMSMVGPRPERPFFVEKFKKEIPFYARRLHVLPGITGWAQIKQGYDASIDDVKSKLKYDLYYIENMSLRIDLKILFNTFYTMIMGRGQ